MSRWSTTPRHRVQCIVTTDFPHELSIGTSTWLGPEQLLSHNELLILVGEFTSQHGRPVVEGKGMGRFDRLHRNLAFRWVWENRTEGGVRMVDTLIVKSTNWSA